MGEPSIINTGVLQRNPFPGSRPFTSAEDQLFFGRDKSVSDLLDILLRRRFVALVGPSASGKTSLIQSGVIPALLSDMKKEWVPIHVRPGRRPMESLIRGVQQVFPKNISESDVHAFLKGSQSIGDFIFERGLGNYHYFLVVDQFEELFTWPVNGKKKKGGKNPEALQFISHLMNLLDEDKPRIYLMLSIRSDFLSNCSNFRVLTEHLNKSKFLLTPMNQDELKDTILEPLRLEGAPVEQGFETYLLNELENVEPQLPLLQHALKQTWEHWNSKGDTARPITLDDYQSGGSIRNGLSRDLENAYESLEFYQKEICERIFKTIAFKTASQDRFGRRTTLGNIARIAQCSLDRVVEVVEVFDKAGNAFLGRQNSTVWSSDSEIELSHESLITIWDRLHQWVDEEDESIRMYLKLSKASASYQQGKGSLLVASDLQKAIDWKKAEKPSPAWGIQFDPAFERAMVFLNTSEEEYIWNEKRKIILARRKIILNRSIIIGSVVVVGIVALLLYISKNKPIEPDQQSQTIFREVRPSFNEDSEAGFATDGESGNAVDEAAPQMETEQETETLVREEPSAAPVEQVVIRDDEPAGTLPSDLAANEEETATVVEETEAHTGANERDMMLSLAKDVANQSTMISKNPDLQGLLAYQAYQFNRSYNGNAYDRDIYSGLYEALKKLISPAYNIYPKLRHSVKAMEWLGRSGSILAASSDGSMKILSGNIADRAAQMDLAGTGYNNECMGVSPDERIAAVGTSGGGMIFIELENRGQVVHQNTDQGANVFFIENLGNSGRFLSAGTDNRILKWDYTNYSSSELVSLRARPLAIATTPDGNVAAIGTRNGKLYVVNTNDPSSLAEIDNYGSNYNIRALAFSPRQRFLAAGLLDGSVKVLNGNSGAAVATLFGPGARITDLEFSPDGRFLVAASGDGNVYLWNSANWRQAPLVFTENNGFVYSVCFSGNSSFFYSGSKDYPRMVGRPTDPEQMVKAFCTLLGRNLTGEEWTEYFGEDIPFEETCPR